MKTRNVVVILAVVLVAGAGLLSTRSFDPVIGLPGGRLSGTELASPTQWSETVDVSTVQLETRPGDPYSVNVWGVGIGPDFYVSTRPEGTAWSNNIDANGNVRLRVGETLYSLKAVSVADDAERKRVVDAYAQKYETDPGEMAATAGLIYRLDTR